MKVTNKTAVVIKACYGQLVSFSDLPNKTNEVPPSSVRYAWTTNRGGNNCRISDIGPNSWDYLDIIYVFGDNNIFYTPVLQKDNWTRAPLYPLPIGEYQAEIQVGSEVENFPPTHICLRIKYKGGIDLHVQSV